MHSASVRWLTRFQQGSGSSTFYSMKGAIRQRRWRTIITSAKTEAVPPPNQVPPYTSLSLGLWKPYIEDNLKSILELDEVQEALQWRDEIDAVSNAGAIARAKRASEIFAGYKPKGKEHLASLALLAERQVLGGRENVTQSVRTMLELQSIDLENPHTLFALSKAMLLAGDVSNALDVATELLNLNQVQQNPILWSMGVNFKLICWLIRGNGEKEVLSPTDQFQMLYAGLKREAVTIEPRDPTLSAILYNTLGIMESPSIQVGNLNAMDSSFSRAIALTRGKTSVLDIRIASVSRSNYAWSLLDASGHLEEDLPRIPDDAEEVLKRASTLANQSLKIAQEASYEVGQIENEFALGRTLSLLALLHVKADAAVTAEGLFQSAIDHSENGYGSMNATALYQSYDQYAKLLSKWDKREADSKLYMAKRDYLAITNDEDDKDTWTLKHPLVPGFLMVTPGDLALYGKMPSSQAELAIEVGNEDI